MDKKLLPTVRRRLLPTRKNKHLLVMLTWHRCCSSISMNGAEHPTREPESESDVVRRLARYVRTNPLAGDTKEGIAQWWLGLPPASSDLVERAIGLLQAAGLIEAVCALDGRVHYRRVTPDAQSDARLDRLIATGNAYDSEP